MTTRASAARAVLDDLSSHQIPPATRLLLVELLWLALPVVAENMLHMMVGLTDVYLGSHLPDPKVAASARSMIRAPMPWEMSPDMQACSAMRSICPDFAGC